VEWIDRDGLKKQADWGTKVNDDKTEPEFDLGNFLPYMLNQVAEAVSKSFQLRYHQDFGLSRTQWRILAHLYVQDGLTAKEIGARIHEDKVSISRGVAALESSKRLSRQPGSRDRRFEVLHLTREGRELFARLMKRAHAFESDLANALGKESTEELRRLLMKVLPLLRDGKLDGEEPDTSGGEK
jgi:DNA-binding MarR family transcriptional regulator